MRFGSDGIILKRSLRVDFISVWSGRCAEKYWAILGNCVAVPLSSVSTSGMQYSVRFACPFRVIYSTRLPWLASSAPK